MIWQRVGFFPILPDSDAIAGELGLADHKRLELDRAITTNPDVLLLDEALAGLTPTDVAEAMEIVRKIHHDMGLTILMLEQKDKQTLQRLHSAYIMETGHITLHGPGKELLEDPHIKKAYLGL